MELFSRKPQPDLTTEQVELIDQYDRLLRQPETLKVAQAKAAVKSTLKDSGIERHYTDNANGRWTRKR